MGHPTSLSPAELEVIARWMDRDDDPDAAGGLFAVGDHAGLGAALCSAVPRARSMRRWTAAQGVPPANGPTRKDTLLRGHNAAYTFDDESDDQPMPVTWTPRDVGSWNPFIRREAPHPLLCGTDGVIDILPDHPHEGEVLGAGQVNLNATFTFGSLVNRPEYPSVGGTRPEPEIVARAHVRGGHSPADFKGVANAGAFGVIGAYDGHPADVGRVAVDSTWHHWFDVNLVGRPVSSLDSAPMDGTNPKTLGFFATPAGMNALARIDNYFRNVALWLSSRRRQRCMFLRATWGVVVRYPLIERLRPDLPLHLLGGVAHDAIGRRASQCTVSSWIGTLFPLELIEVFKEPPPPRPDPCLTCPPFELIERYLLGGVTREMLVLAEKLDDGSPPDGREIDEGVMLEAFFGGAKLGLTKVQEHFRASLRRGQRLQRVFAEQLLRLPEPATFLSGRQG